MMYTSSMDKEIIITEESQKVWWMNNATYWREECEKAWLQRDLAWEKIEWLESELIKERGEI